MLLCSHAPMLPCSHTPMLLCSHAPMRHALCSYAPLIRHWYYGISHDYTISWYNTSKILYHGISYTNVCPILIFVLYLFERYSIYPPRSYIILYYSRYNIGYPIGYTISFRYVIIYARYLIIIDKLLLIIFL